MSTSIKNLHGDIIYGEIPRDKHYKEDLLKEIKNRANKAFKLGNFEEAYVLYSRGLEIDPVSYLLYGNRSLTLLKMDKLETALVDAIQANTIKPDWDKGCYRRGQVYEKLERYIEAKHYYEKSMDLSGTNKKIKQKIAELESKITNKNKNVNNENKLITETTNSKSRAQIKPKSNFPNELTGYKLKSDGRKTTFFDHEQTEEEKKLIGNIQPKKISDNLTGAVNKKGIGSAWSNGSTYEEKNMNTWAKPFLKNILLSTIFFDEKSGLNITIEELEKFKGDASIAVVKNKIRHIFNFSFTIKWNLEYQEEIFTGELKYMDIDNDYEISDLPKLSSDNLNKQLEKYVLNEKNSLHSNILLKIAEFNKQFKTKAI